MSDDLQLEGLGVAPNVLDTIVCVAVEGVDGVIAVGAPGLAGLVQRGARKGTARAVDVTVGEDESLSVAVHVQLKYGEKLRDVAGRIQDSVTEALTSQVGVKVAAVDVFVDGLVFDE